MCVSVIKGDLVEKMVLGYGLEGWSRFEEVEERLDHEPDLGLPWFPLVALSPGLFSSHQISIY